MPNAPIELGETYNYLFQAKDAAGANITPGSVTASAILPDGSTSAMTVTGVSPAAIAYTTAQVGRHVLTGTATGGALGTDVKKFEDTFNVEPVGRYVVGLDEALAHLAAVGILTQVNDLEQLRWYILAASDAIERDLGRTVARQVITAEKVSGGGDCIRLRRTPVISISTIVENSTTLTNASGVDWVVDELEGTGYVYRGSPTAPGVWSWGRANIAVTYVAGMAVVPAVVRKVVLNAVERMWQSAQNAGHPGLVDDVSADAAVFASVGSSLTAVEQGAYNSLRAWG